MFILNENFLVVISLIIYAEMANYNCNGAGIGSIDVNTSSETTWKIMCFKKSGLQIIPSGFTRIPHIIKTHSEQLGESSAVQQNLVWRIKVLLQG